MEKSNIIKSYTIKDYMQWSSEIHNMIEDELRTICIPGAKLIDIVKYIEQRIDQLTEQYLNNYIPTNVDNKYNYISHGKAFPVGINLNEIAAHWSPLTNDDQKIIKKTDVVTIDYGIHFDGYILDAAFSFAYDEQHRKLLECGLQSCQETAKMVKVGQPIYMLSCNIMKIAKKYNYSLIRDLCGHQIEQYKIHNGFVIPNCDMNLKKNLSIGSIFTIEPFISTGKGAIYYTDEISHYMFNYHTLNYEQMEKNDQIPNFLKSYKTLAFNRRHILESDYSELDNLIKKGIYIAYPPIVEQNKSAYVCQFETTIYIESQNNIINYKQHGDISKYLLIQ